MKVEVVKISHCKYIALINNGWWAAYGRTEKEAVKKVNKRYSDEACKHLGYYPDGEPVGRERNE